MALIHKSCLILLFTTFLSLCCARATIRFAVITDTHITSTDSLSSLRLQQLVELINHTDSVDFVVITGDITQNADSISFDAAKQTLDALIPPYHCIAGNHDIRNDSTLLFTHFFGDDRFSFSYKGINFIGFSAIPKSRSAEAIINEHTLLWLSQQLLNRNKTILFTHYPLQQGDITNRNELSELLSQQQLILTVSGHYHRYMLLAFQDSPNIIHRAPQRTGDNTLGYTLYLIDKDTIQIYEHIYGEEPSLWMTLPL